MKIKKITSLLLGLGIISSNLAYAKDYTNYPQKYWDLDKTHWAYEYISELTDKNVISGYDDGSFKPNKTVTRAEWAKLLCIASGKQVIISNNVYAKDYNKSDWFASYIDTIKEYLNFYNINNESYYKPNQAITREDVVASLVKLKGYDLSEVDYSNITQFSDFNSISNNMKAYISIAISNELITGFENNTFRAQDTLSRAEAATLLCRAFQLGDINKSNEYVENNIKNNLTNTDSKDYYDTYYSNLINQNKNNEITSNKVNDDSSNKQYTINNNTAINASKNNTNSDIKPLPDENSGNMTNSVLDSSQYSVDVLLKVSLDSYFDTNIPQYVYWNDSIYYYNSSYNTINKFDIYDKNDITICNLNDITDQILNCDNDKYFETMCREIYYDNYKNLVGIHVETKNDNNELFDYLIEIDDNNNEISVIGDDVTGKALTHIIIQASKLDGKYIVMFRNKFGSNVASSDFLSINGCNADVGFPIYERDSDIICAKAGENQGCYLWDLDLTHPIEKYNTFVSPVLYTANSLIYLSANKIIEIDYKGNDINSVCYNDIKIKDHYAIKQSSFDKIAYLTKSNDVVFYDTANKAFRIISITN